MVKGRGFGKYKNIEAISRLPKFQIYGKGKDENLMQPNLGERITTSMGRYHVWRRIRSTLGCQKQKKRSKSRKKKN